MAAAERRQHLVETAIRLFTEGSYHGTTTAEIARAAGVSEPILYRHFASKRDLYLAALEHVWAKTRESLGAGARRDSRRVCRDRGDRQGARLRAVAEAPARRAVGAGAERGLGGSGAAAPPAQAHARGARLRREIWSGVVKTRERSPRTGTPTPKRGSCSQEESSAWSEGESACSTTRSSQPSAPLASPGFVGDLRFKEAGDAPNEKAPAAAPGPSPEVRHSRREIGGGSAAHPLSVPLPGVPGAPPANLGLASGLVARCAHYRSVSPARQVARSSDFAFRMVDRILR